MRVRACLTDKGFSLRLLRLEHELHRHLDDARIAGVGHRARLPDCIALNLPESAAVQGRYRRTEIDPVRKIERLRADLQRHPLPDPERSHAGHIELEHTRAF